MVLRSGKRRSLNESSSDSKQKIDKKEKDETAASKHSPKNTKPESDSDDEAPEDVGFAESRQLTLEGDRKKQEQIRSDRDRAKEKRRLRAERNRKQKEAKAKRIKLKGQELPMEVLEQAAKEQKANKVKQFDDDDLNDDDDEEEVTFAEKKSQKLSSSLRAVTARDERSMLKVAPHIANLKHNLLFGGRIRREDAAAAARRRDKVAKCGLGVKSSSL